MRDHLDSRAKIISSSLFSDNVRVNPPSREIVPARHLSLHKPLVMPKIQISLCTVGCNEHLAMLKRAHGSRINVDIGI